MNQFLEVMTEQALDLDWAHGVFDRLIVAHPQAALRCQPFDFYSPDTLNFMTRRSRMSHHAEHGDPPRGPAGE